jgi:hypothetical protein
MFFVAVTRGVEKAFAKTFLAAVAKLNVKVKDDKCRNLYPPRRFNFGEQCCACEVASAIHSRCGVIGTKA